MSMVHVLNISLYPILYAVFIYECGGMEWGAYLLVCPVLCGSILLLGPSYFSTLASNKLENTCHFTHVIKFGKFAMWRNWL